jgi:hypothetical protein
MLGYALCYCLLIVTLVSPTSACRGKQIMSEQDIPQNGAPNGESSDDVPSIPELDKYIFTLDEYQAGIVPRKLEHAKVARYLIGKIKRDLGYKNFLRVESVADFYDTNEVVDKFKGFLDKTETDEESIRRSIVITRIIARAGSPEAVEFAKQYNKHLIQKAETILTFEDLILLHEALGLGSASQDLRAKIGVKAKSLEQKKDSDYRARLEHRQLTGPLLQKLNRAEKVEPVKQKIVEIRDRKERIREEIRAYLTIEYGYLEYLQPWAARRLRRETWAANPPEQLNRNDAAPLKKDLVDQLRAFLNSSSDSPGGKPAGDEALKLRLLRAIKFFGGEVSEEEQTFLDTQSNQQADILANEGFMLSE